MHDIYRTSRSDDFVAYGVINDGGQAGERTGDGAFALSAPKLRRMGD